MTRVLFVITGLERAGAETALTQLIAKLKDEGVECGCLALRDGPCKEDLRALDVPTFVMERPLLGVRTYRVMGALAFARRFAPTVVQGWMYHGNLFALALTRVLFPKVPLHWAIRHGLGSLAQERWGTALAIRIAARLSRCVDSIVYNSYRSAERHEQLGFDPNRSVVILNGVDTTHFVPDVTKRIVLRKRLGVTDQRVLIGVIARNHPDKDPLNFINALDILNQRLSSVCALMVGKGYEAITASDLSRRLCADGYLTYHAATADILSTMQGLDLLVCPSRNESFPNVVAESMACGVPCVVTDVGDAALLVGESGRVVAPGDSVALALAIERVVRLSLLERRNLQTSARERIVSHFSAEIMREKYLAIYRGKGRHEQELTEKSSIKASLQGGG